MTSHLDTYAALTALFTTSDQPDAPVAHASDPTPAIIVPPAPRIEIIVPGHLPVRAGVWFLPCAHRLAGTANAGVLIQCEDDLAQLTAFGTTGSSGDRTSLLDGFATQARRWFLLPSNDADPVNFTSLGADRITILTGTDQAAVVAAYQTIKSIVAGCGAERERLDLGVFIAGSSEPSAAEAAERLGDTTRRQLGCDLVLRGCMPQLEAVDQSLHREHVHLEGGVARLISDIRRAMTVAAVETPIPQPAVVEVPVPVVPPPLSVAEPVADSSAPHIETMTPTPSPEPTPIVDAVVDVESLAAHVEGLSVLPVRCPHHESIELAVDADGTLQVLATIDDLPALLAVEAWAQSHAELLSRACRESSIQADAAPQLHVFADAVGQLTALHGTSIRLHLLVTVEVGPHRTRYATPIS